MPSAGINLGTAPSSDEVEVSLFGPGFGECVVLHLGFGDWAVIDSSLDAGSKEPAALHYLNNLGIDPARSVRLVVASHWHDDHMQGLGEVFEACKDASFVCTAAVHQRTFREILASWMGTRLQVWGSGVDEMNRVLAELRRRSLGGGCPAPKLASANKELWVRRSSQSARVTALSPSDAAALASVARLEGVIPRSTKARRRIPLIEPNDAAIVLSVEVGSERLLLGGDLEVVQNPGLGWLAIVDLGRHDRDRHKVFKIPHHGSPTADHDEVWQKMLTDQPWVATTPFVQGNVRLPAISDCQRIVRRTRRSYLTAPPSPARFQDPNPTVAKTVREVTRSVHSIPGSYGHVRIRKRIDHESNWSVGLFGKALSMEQYIREAQRC